MKKLMTVGTLAITAALLVAASNFGLQNATAAGTAAATAAAATKAATAAPIPTISALATADVNLAVAGSGKVTGPLAGEAQALNASGATFPLNLYLNWAKTYKDLTGVAVNYTGGGSGKGRNDIIANAVD